MMKHKNAFEYARELIHGSGGLHSMEAYEVVVFADRDVAVAFWVLRCLANADSEDARSVVKQLANRHGLLAANDPFPIDLITDNPSQDE